MNLLKINGCYDHRVDDMDIAYNNELTNEFEGYLACAENNYLIGTINSKKNKEKKKKEKRAILKLQKKYGK